MSESYDVLIIGSGPGGYIAAIRAAQLGLRTGIVERKELGGICLNWGCIPTKALLHGADIANTLADMSAVGYTVGDVTFDLSKLVAHSRKTSAKLSGGVAYLMKKNGIEVVQGTAKLVGKGLVDVTDADGGLAHLRADHVILATGARPRPLPGIVPDGDRIWTYFQALVPEEVPERLIVVGSGAIGSEFASLYNDLGSQVTTVEFAPQVLPVEDAAVAAEVQRQFERRGIEVHTSSTLSDVEVVGDEVHATLNAADGSTTPIAADRLLLAAGIQANTQDLGLEDLGVELDRGYVKIDEWGRTNVAGLYAIGDVAGPPCLAHKASREGVVCVEHLAGVAGTVPVDKTMVPGCTYTSPEVASLGATEAQVVKSGRPYRVGVAHFSANGRAIGMGDSDGFVKTIFDQGTGELLGAHMVGPGVTEQVQGFGILHALEGTDDDLANVVFAHPSLSETMHESVLTALGRPLSE